MCPDGLVLDGSGGCIPKDQCPCVHGGHFYRPGETIKVDCNTWYVILGSLVFELRLLKLACMVGPRGRVYFEAFLFITRAIRLSENIKGETFPLYSTLHKPALEENKYQAVLPNSSHPSLKLRSPSSRSTSLIQVGLRLVAPQGRVESVSVAHS